MKISSRPITFLFYLILQIGLLGCGGEAEDIQAQETLEHHAPASSSLTSNGPLLIGITDGFLTVETPGSPLQKVLDTIARKSGILIFLDPAADEQVSVSFQDLPLDEGLRRILRKKNAAFIYSRTSSEDSKAVIPRLEEVYVLADNATGASPAVLVLPETELNMRNPLANQEAVQELAQVMFWDKDSHRRQEAARTLGKIGNTDAVDLLALSLSENGDSAVREASAKALEEFGSPKTVRSLITALGDKDEYVRESAADALGKIGSLQAEEALVEASIYDKDVWVRKSAKKALRKILQNTQ